MEFILGKRRWSKRRRGITCRFKRVRVAETGVFEILRDNEVNVYNR